MSGTGTSAASGGSYFGTALKMPRCTNKGCEQEYKEEKNAEGDCSYHPGGPVFHEGLKSWSCCNEVNKPVLEFDQFMAIPPCTKGKHSSEKPPEPIASVQNAAASSSAGPTFTSQNGVETYGTAAPTRASSSKPDVAVATAPPEPEPPRVEHEDDDLSLPVPDNAPCKRIGCKARWEREEVSRGDGPAAKCKYHPQGAIFHEGSKGYLCCKRRVLEFDEFLKIEGCTEGKHLFVGQKKDEQQEEVVSCRMDHYQTPLQVHVSAFAKGADKERSSVLFETQQLHLDLYLPQNRRVKRSVTLYGPIDPSASTFRILSTKVDIVLQKPAPASWPLLELPPAGTELPPGYALTFGVSGRTGTVGGKEIVLAPEERAKRQ